MDSPSGTSGAATSEAQDPAGEEQLTPAADQSTAMEQDPQPGSESQPGPQPGGVEQAPIEQAPVSQTPVALSEDQTAAGEAPPTPSKHTEPAIEQDEPAPSAPAPADPASPAPAGAEEEPAPLPPPEPVPLIPLDRAEMVNSLLAGRRAVTAICRPPVKLQLPLPQEGFMCDQCGER